MRIKSIDFLRGIAIILVLFRHIDYAPIAYLIGWSGVDLFFVLSGFLVSGLLFKEYQKTNTIRPGLFLIRRGFKIYPMFWAILLYVVVIHNFTGLGTANKDLFAELFFYQNYTSDGLLTVTWSLAVEEHFYILLIIAVGLAVKYKRLEHKKGFHIVAFSILAFCLVARILTSIQYPTFSFYTHYTPTHLRIDALTFGVIIAYNFHFNKAWLSAFVNRNKKAIAALCIACLIPLFFFESSAIFMRTIGYTLTYIGFGSLVMLFLLVDSVSIRIEKYFSTFLYDLVSMIGLYSYAIYLVHLQVLIAFRRIIEEKYGFFTTDNTLFVWYFFFSILVGAILTFTIENPFLKLREKLFPVNKKQEKKEITPQVQPA